MFKKIIVSICIVATLAVCAVGLLGCEFNKTAENIKLEYTNDFEIVTDNEGVINATIEEPRLLLSSGVATINENGSVTKTVCAELFPHDTAITDVRWNIYWETEPVAGADINEYFVISARDGELSYFKYCDVTCIKGFLGGVAKLVVTSVDGGFDDDCTLTYAGVPTDISVEHAGTNYGSSAEIDLTTANTGTNININLSNVLGEVGADYSNLSIKSIALKGTMRVMFHENNDSTLTSQNWISAVRYNFTEGRATYISRLPGTEEKEIETFYYNSEVNLSESAGAFGATNNKMFYGIEPSDFATITLNGSTLNVIPRMAFRGYFKTVIIPMQAGNQDYFFKYLDSSSSNPPCIVVKVQNDYTGLVADITINLLTGVTGIELNSSELVF